MVKYTSLIKKQLGSFAIWKLNHIPRDSNEKANALVVVDTSILIRETMFLSVYY